MIMNPAIQGGGGEKEYTITGGHSDMPTKAKPGTSILITTAIDPIMPPNVTAANGLIIPVAVERSYPEIKQASRVPMSYYYFIMPAQDVTLSR